MVRHDHPIKIKSRETETSEQSIVIEYKLSEDELKKLNEKLGPPRKQKGPIKLEIRGKQIVDQKTNKPDLNVDGTVDLTPKKLNKEKLKELLNAGQTFEQIAGDYNYDIKIVKMLYGKLNPTLKKEKVVKQPAAPVSKLKITVLEGDLLTYDIQGVQVTMGSELGEIAGLSKPDIKGLIDELQELLGYMPD